MNQENSRENLKYIFTQYLDKKGHRKTPERFAILDEIFSFQGHFNIKSLYLSMKDKNYTVSRATLYNTIDLLLESNLIIKHQFRNNITCYEKIFECARHDHLICTSCGAVIEFNEPEIQKTEEKIARMMNFTMTHRSIYFYGICENCLISVCP
ncbi:MAG: transcriptional repressor [Bacteroidia bacterium]|nr:transcriptional repressor [Bacteroidia bacterium]